MRVLRLVQKFCRSGLGRYSISLGLASVVMIAVIRLNMGPLLAPQAQPATLSDSLLALSVSEQIPNLNLNATLATLPQGSSLLVQQAAPSPALPLPSLPPTATPIPHPPAPDAIADPNCLAKIQAPRWLNIPADPSNYGERFGQDAFGRPVTNAYLIVLHETVNSGSSAINMFQTAHPRDEDQLSYHDLILRDGTIVHLVPWEKRAYGAGNSEFRGEAVQTNPKLPSSVNNFTLHFSLETPPDGNNNRPSHSGYTAAQYRSLAWLVAQTGITDDRITTHKAVDRASGKQDPRSFNGRQFLTLVQQFRSEKC